MSLDVTSNRFQDKDLNAYDVMQHVRNIYNILGVLYQKDMAEGNANNVVERLDDITKNPLIKAYFDTVEEYKAALQAGTVSPNDLCYVKSSGGESFDPEGNKVYVGNLQGIADRARADEFGNNIADTYVSKLDCPYAIGPGIELSVDANGILSITYDDGQPDPNENS